MLHYFDSLQPHLDFPEVLILHHQSDETQDQFQNLEYWNNHQILYQVHQDLA